MALTLNLPVPSKFVTIPVAAGLALGAAAFGAYFAQSTPVAASVISDDLVAAKPVDAVRPCERQTWPYLENRCVADRASSARPVRVVMAPAPGEASRPSHVVAPQEAIDEASKALELTSRDTVLRQPEIAPAPKVDKRKRSDRRGERRWVAQSYDVPAQYGRRVVTVTRPQRIEFFR